MNKVQNDRCWGKEISKVPFCHLEDGYGFHLATFAKCLIFEPNLWKTPLLFKIQICNLKRLNRKRLELRRNLEPNLTKNNENQKGFIFGANTAFSIIPKCKFSNYLKFN